MQRKEEANSKLSKALEKVESLDKSKDTFIATASHELKGPVTILSGYLSMIKNDNLKPKDFKDAVNRAYEGSQNLSVLTKRLFDINRIQMHKLEINSSVFSIEDIGKDLITDYKNTNQNSNIKFCFKKTGKIPLVLADKELIKEVIINLLNNAMKFTNEGSITLSISENPSEVICAIKDTGKGISKEDQEKIFKKFYQTKESEASHLGLGLGLNLCHEIVKAHKGNIWVESELDKGSTFYFSIPKEPALVR
jgi:signal transduction histidine kinase